MRIQAIIFDMDGLMLDTERVGKWAFETAAAELRMSLPGGTYHALIGRPQQDTRGILYGLLGQDFPVEQLCRRSHQIYTQFVETTKIPMKKGLIPLLDFIEAQGLKLAVATSTAHELAIKKLTLVGIVDRFPVVTCGDEVERGKPEPDIYLEAARRLNVPPRACIALEDSIAGVRAAHAAGMRTIMVPDLMAPTDEIRTLAHAIVETLEGAVEIIRNRDVAHLDGRA